MTPCHWVSDPDVSRQHGVIIFKVGMLQKNSSSKVRRCLKTLGSCNSVT